MSERAQKVRERRMQKIQTVFAKDLETVFNYVLDEMEQRTLKNDFSPVQLKINMWGNYPYIINSPKTKINNSLKYLKINNHRTFIEMLCKKFNDEDGFKAKIEIQDDDDNHKTYVLFVNVEVS